MGQLSCPKCGYSLEEEGAILSTCPRCELEVPPSESQPSTVQPLVAPVPASGKLDVAGLMRRILAEQRATWHAFVAAVNDVMDAGDA